MFQSVYSYLQSVSHSLVLKWSYLKNMQNVISHTQRSALIPKSDYYKTIEDIQIANQMSITSHGLTIYWKRMKFCCVWTLRNKVCKHRHPPWENHISYVIIEDTYDVINKAHVAPAHGGRGRMIEHLVQKYANICQE